MPTETTRIRMACDDETQIAATLRTYADVYALSLARRRFAGVCGPASLQRLIVWGRYDFGADGNTHVFSRALCSDTFRALAPRVMTESRFFSFRHCFIGREPPLGGVGPGWLRPPDMRCAGCGEGWAEDDADDYRVEQDDREYAFRVTAHDGAAFDTLQSLVNEGRTDCRYILRPMLLPHGLRIGMSDLIRNGQNVLASVERYYHRLCNEQTAYAPGVT